MARPTSISTAQILLAARALFLERGVTASTAEIARRAGVSEGSLFKRFGTKEELFTAAMAGAEVPQWAQRLEALVGQGRLQDNLVDIAVDIIAFLRELLPRLMMSWSHRKPPSGFLSGIQGGPRRELQALARYLQAEVQRKRLRRCDPELVARILIGSLTNFVFYEMLGVNAGPSDDPRAYARALVDALWQGLAPTSVAPRRK